MAENTGNGGVILSLATASGENNTVQYNSAGKLAGTNQYYNTQTGNTVFGFVDSADQSQSALVAFNSDAKVIQLPRIQDITAITSPQIGLFGYDVKTHSLKYYNGEAWVGSESGIEAAITDIQNNYNSEKAEQPTIVIENSRVESYTHGTNVSFTVAQQPVTPQNPSGMYLPGVTQIYLNQTTPNRDPHSVPDLPVRLSIEKYLPLDKKYLILTKCLDASQQLYECIPPEISQNQFIEQGIVVESQMTKLGLPAKSSVSVSMAQQTEDIFGISLTKKATNQTMTAFREIFAQQYRITGKQQSNPQIITAVPVIPTGRVLYQTTNTQFPVGTQVLVMKNHGIHTAWGNNFKTYSVIDTVTSGTPNTVTLMLDNEIPDEAVGELFCMYKLPPVQLWMESGLSFYVPVKVEPTSVLLNPMYKFPDEISRAWLMQDSELEDYAVGRVGSTSELVVAGTGATNVVEILGTRYRGGFGTTTWYEYSQYSGYNTTHVQSSQQSGFRYLAASCFTLTQSGNSQILLSCSTIGATPTGDQLAVIFSGVNQFIVSIGNYSKTYNLPFSVVADVPHTLILQVNTANTSNPFALIVDGSELTATATTGTLPNSYEATKYPLVIGKNWAGRIGGVVLSRKNISTLKLQYFSFLLNTYNWAVPVLDLFYKYVGVTADRLTVGCKTVIDDNDNEFNFDLGSGFIVR